VRVHTRARICVCICVTKPECANINLSMLVIVNCMKSSEWNAFPDNYFNICIIMVLVHKFVLRFQVLKIVQSLCTV